MITTCYVQFVPEVGYGGKVRSVKAARITQHKPIKLAPGAVVIKLNLDLPQEIFDAYEVHVKVDDRVSEQTIKVAADVEALALETKEFYEGDQD